MFEDKRWFLARAGTITGPFTADHVEKVIGSKGPTEEILFWSRGQLPWLDCSLWKGNLQEAAFTAESRETKTSELPKVIERFEQTRDGIRASILGSVKLEFGGKIYSSRAFDMSVDGMGVMDLGPVPVGEIVPAVINSPNLTSMIHVNAQIVYRKSSGEAGLRLIGLSAENTSTIVDYLKRFSELHASSSKDCSSGLGRNI